MVGSAYKSAVARRPTLDPNTIRSMFEAQVGRANGAAGAFEAACAAVDLDAALQASSNLRLSLLEARRVVRDAPPKSPTSSRGSRRLNEMRTSC